MLVAMLTVIEANVSPLYADAPEIEVKSLKVQVSLLLHCGIL